MELAAISAKWDYWLLTMKQISPQMLETHVLQQQSGP
jgi:hypothetical protein